MIIVCYSMLVCCGAVYKSDSNDLILIDVSKFKPCHQRRRSCLAHLTAVTRDAEVLNTSSHHVFSSASASNSLSTQDSDQVSVSNGLSYEPVPDQDANFSSQLSLSASVNYEQECEDENEDEDNDDSSSILQTDESMEPESPSRDTDDEMDRLPATAMAATRTSILCKLLWNNRPNNQENQPDFVWSESVDSWPSPLASTVKVFP